MITYIFNNFVSELQKTTPGLKIKYKDKSTFMKLLGFLLFFNKSFMVQYITTIGNTVYFPSQEFVVSKDMNATIILSHEYVHIRDSANNIFFKLLYLFPQILMPIICLFGFLWWPLFFISLIFLFPLPAPFRSKFELVGYKMSLFTEDYMMKLMQLSEVDRKAALLNSVTKINNEFTKSGYYFMNPLGVLNELNKTVDDIISGDIINGDYYQDVLTALNNSQGN